MVFGDPDVIEHQFGGVGGMPPHLVQGPAGAESFGPLLDGEDGYSPRPSHVGIGLGGNEDQFGEPAVGDEHLGPVESPALPIASGSGPNGGHVRPGIGLGDRDGGDHLAGGEPGQPPALLLL